MENTEIAQITEKTKQLDHMTSSRLTDSLFSKDLAPHYMKLATQLASSELVPKSFRGKPQDLFICWAMGYQAGLTPEQSMQCIAVINGKPAMYGDDMLALCMVHKEFEDIVEEPILNGSTIVGYTCTVKRKGRADKVNSFTLEMAKKAGLLAKGGVWTQYPERMLKLRARGFSLRDAFPDALKGIKPREEVEDYIDAEYKVVENKGLSRTELLKQDLLTKKGKQDEQVERFDSDVDYQENSKKDVEEINPGKVGQMGTEKINLHSQIKRFIEEKGIIEERVLDWLKYYEADSIDALDLEAASHLLLGLKDL